VNENLPENSELYVWIEEQLETAGAFSDEWYQHKANDVRRREEERADIRYEESFHHFDRTTLKIFPNIQERPGSRWFLISYFAIFRYILAGPTLMDTLSSRTIPNNTACLIFSGNMYAFGTECDCSLLDDEGHTTGYRFWVKSISQSFNTLLKHLVLVHVPCWGPGRDACYIEVISQNTSLFSKE
jgi:hypothetical protein